MRLVPAFVPYVVLGAISCATMDDDVVLETRRLWPLVVGILAEKPSQARNFAKALGGMRGTYKGTDYVIAASRGHLYELLTPDRQVAADKAAAYKSWKLEYLPWKYEDLQFNLSTQYGAKSVVDDIKRTFKGVDEIVIATDDDPTYEGSALACEIIEEAPLRAKKYSRMYFVDESAPQVTKAFENRVPIDDISTWNEWVTARFRSRWDYMAGLQLTRAASSFTGGASVIRTGRLKSAMVVIVGQQLDAIANYKKVPYYDWRFKDENGVEYTDPKQPQFETKDAANVFSGNFHPSAVVNDGVKTRAVAPPKLLDLAGLSALLAPKGFNADTVLKTYQRMYEAQVVSYPRTEDKTITPEQFDELVANVDRIAQLVGVDPAMLTVRAPRKTHVKPQGAHGANRPGPNVPASMSALDSYGPGAQDIYRILALSALRMFAPDKQLKIESGHVADFPTFKGSATTVTDPGWSALLSDDDDEPISKHLGTKATPGLHEGFAPKPQAPTMKWLFKQLEKYDCGTGATRTSTYAEMCKAGKKNRALFKDSRGKITLTDNGQISYMLLPGTHIGSLELTHDVLQYMRDIHDGKIAPDEPLKKIAAMVEEDIETMRKNFSVTKLKAKGITMNDLERFDATDDKGQSHSIPRVFRGHRLTDEQIDALNNGEEVTIEGLTSKKGATYSLIAYLGEEDVTFSDGNTRRLFHVCSKLPDNGNGGANDKATSPDYFSVVDPSTKRTRYVKRLFRGHKISDEEADTLRSGGTVVLDLKAKSGSTYKYDIKLGTNTFTNAKGEEITYYGIVGDFHKGVPEEFCKHRFTDEEISQLEDGQTIYVDGLVSKKGNQFGANLSYDADKGRIEMSFDN